MKVISGSLKGRNIEGFTIDGTRPTMDRVKEAIESTIEENGCHLKDVLYVKEDSLNYLRIVIFKNGGIDVDDCVLISKAISPIIDKLDPIEESYILDVCSMEGNEEDE